MTALDPVTQEFIANTIPYVDAMAAATAAANEFARAAAAAAAASQLPFGGADFSRMAASLDSIQMYSHQSALALEDVNQHLADAARAGPAAAAGAAAAGRGFGIAGALAALAATRVTLFGGAFGAIPVLGTIGGLHLLSNAVLDIAATLIPATLGVVAFGAAAVPTVQDVTQHFKALNTVTQATGQNLPPMTGGFTRLADAVKPQVYQLLGDALTVIDHKGSAFSAMAVSAGHVVDQLGARFTVAATQGRGFGQFMANSAADLSGWGNLAGNVGGIIGNILRQVPGYAQYLLSFAGAVTHVAESITGSRLGQDILGVGLAFHGAVIYAGLAATGIAFAARTSATAIAGWTEKAALAAASTSVLGRGGQVAARGLAAISEGATAAAALPWGWITIAATALGGLIYMIATAKDATQQWVGSLQQSLSAANAIRGVTLLLVDQAAVTNRLASAQRDFAATSAPVIQAAATKYSGAQVLNSAYAQQSVIVGELTAAQQQMSGQWDTYNTRLSALSHTYGSTTTAQGLLTAAGVTMGQMLDKSNRTWEIIRAQVAATALAYTAMGQTSGRLGADMSVMTRLTDSQYTAMAQLNQAWDTYLGLTTSFESSSAGAIRAFRQLTADAHATGATMTGVSTASLKLQDDFNTQLAPATQKVIDGMRQANAPVTDLANVVATYLNPAVRAGALANDGMRNAIYLMAREAGYAGPDTIGALSRWFDRNKTSVQAAANEVNTYAGALSRIPGNVTTHVQTIYSSSGSPLYGPGAPGHQPLTAPAAAPYAAGPAAPVLPAPGAAGRQAPQITIPVTVAGGGPGATDPQFLQGLHDAIQEAVLRHVQLNQGNGLFLHGKWS